MRLDDAKGARVNDMPVASPTVSRGAVANKGSHRRTRPSYRVSCLDPSLGISKGLAQPYRSLPECVSTPTSS